MAATTLVSLGFFTIILVVTAADANFISVYSIGRGGGGIAFIAQEEQGLAIKSKDGGNLLIAQVMTW